ncbi:low affinity iron permease family protein [Flavobacterium sp. RSB2_4_14]|uniref:low affinity iron permease family protein n=1 Tax=Flavobacterium sp. RSB2_4_14 TaxID=3447665 RepID=UPI003F3A441E
MKVELFFEKITSIGTKILGNSITFILAFIMVIYWWATNLFTSDDAHQNIGDIIFGVTFLSLFVIQKSFNRYSALVHLKINELISSHDQANNEVMNTNMKTEKEIRVLTDEYFTEEVIENEIENEIEKIEEDEKLTNEIKKNDK